MARSAFRFYVTQLVPSAQFARARHARFRMKPFHPESVSGLPWDFILLLYKMEPFYKEAV